MKYFFILTLFIVIADPTISLANNDNGYMEGHPSYNSNYYTPEYTRNPRTPNNGAGHNRAYDANAREHQNQESSTPHGNDIRDYNPYYNRNGSLK